MNTAKQKKGNPVKREPPLTQEELVNVRRLLAAAFPEHIAPNRAWPCYVYYHPNGSPNTVPVGQWLPT